MSVKRVDCFNGSNGIDITGFITVPNYDESVIFNNKLKAIGNYFLQNIKNDIAFVVPDFIDNVNVSSVASTIISSYENKNYAKNVYIRFMMFLKNCNKFLSFGNIFLFHNEPSKYEIEVIEILSSCGFDIYIYKEKIGSEIKIINNLDSLFAYIEDKKSCNIEVSGVYREFYIDLQKYRNKEGIAFVDRCIKKPTYDEALNADNTNILPVIMDECERLGIAPPGLNNYVRVQNILLSRYVGRYKTICFYDITNERDKSFIRIISNFDINVIVFRPDGTSREFPEFNAVSFEYTETPKSVSDITELETLAYNAEKEIKKIMTDNGIYSSMSDVSIKQITLKTTYDEIFINWNEPSKYRQGFYSERNRIIIPTIFSKILGVDDSYDKRFDFIVHSSNTLVYRNFNIPLADIDFINRGEAFNRFIRRIFFNGKINIDEVVRSHHYSYGLYDSNVQALIFSKIEEMINFYASRIGKNSVYDIIGVCLRIPTEIMLMIHTHDFSLSVPKIVIYSNNDIPCSKEIEILLLFLKMMGFDVIIYIPSGMNLLDDFIDKEFNNHIIGKYEIGKDIPKVEATKNGIGKILKKYFKFT